MKSELKVKLLQHLVARKKDAGFTLIELLVVIIIIGILSAIALPSFLNQSNKAKQSEAKQYVGTLNRTQQAQFMEKGAFATDLASMSNPIASETTNYLYGVANPTATQVRNTAGAKSAALRSYSGSVFVTTNAATSETNTTAIACETSVPNQTAPAIATLAGTTATCPTGSATVQ